MSPLHSGAFLAHLSQCNASAKQQVNSIIDAIYAKVLLELKLWLNKHNDSVHALALNHNEPTVNVATGEPMQSMSSNNHQIPENCPPSLLPSHLQSHLNNLTIKNEIDTDCEENVTDHNLHGELEVDSRVIRHNSNEQSTSARYYLPANNKIDDDGNENIGNDEFVRYEASDKLLQTATFTQPPSDQQTNMNFDDDEEFDKETLGEVKKEIEEEEEMKRRENELEGGDERHDEGDRVLHVESELTEANDTQSTFSDNFHAESMVIQLEEMDANNAIGGESRATECTTNPIQPNFVQSNRHLQCSHCHKSFHGSSNLQNHIRVHTGERPFQCDLCDKRFSEKGSLKRHQLIHQNIKNFRCHECDQQFTQKHHLDSHLRTHSGERPYKCRHCSKSFTASDARNRHEQAIHLHVKPYRCKQCAHTANQFANIVTHIRVVHFGLPPTIKQQRALNIVDDRDARELVEKV